MPLMTLIGLIVVLGFGLWLVNRFIPMADPIKLILKIVVVAVIFFAVVYALFPGIGSYTIGR